jgi:hypothetical protein
MPRGWIVSVESPRDYWTIFAEPYVQRIQYCVPERELEKDLAAWFKKSDIPPVYHDRITAGAKRLKSLQLNGHPVSTVFPMGCYPGKELPPSLDKLGSTLLWDTAPITEVLRSVEVPFWDLFLKSPEHLEEYTKVYNALYDVVQLIPSGRFMETIDLPKIMPNLPTGLIGTHESPAKVYPLRLGKVTTPAMKKISNLSCIKPTNLDYKDGPVLIPRTRNWETYLKFDMQLTTSEQPIGWNIL